MAELLTFHQPWLVLARVDVGADRLAEGTVQGASGPERHLGRLGVGQQSQHATSDAGIGATIL